MTKERRKRRENIANQIPESFFSGFVGQIDFGTFENETKAKTAIRKICKRLTAIADNKPLKAQVGELKSHELKHLQSYKGPVGIILYHNGNEFGIQLNVQHDANDMASIKRMRRAATRPGRRDMSAADQETYQRTIDHAKALRKQKKQQRRKRHRRK